MALVRLEHARSIHESMLLMYLIFCSPQPPGCARERLVDDRLPQRHAELYAKVRVDTGEDVPPCVELRIWNVSRQIVERRARLLVDDPKEECDE